jgi:hypothetical protein
MDEELDIYLNDHVDTPHEFRKHLAKLQGKEQSSYTYGGEN